MRETTAKLESSMRNAVIDFSRMTTSVVAVVTDVMRDGKPVVGYGCGSNGRYAQGGILRERLIPRIMEADPETLLDSERDNLDPIRIQACMMQNEKPGGHGDRAVAAAVIDMAVWDAVAKIEDSPLWRVLADRYNANRSDPTVLVYPGGGYYYPGKEIEQLQTEMRTYLEQGYRMVKMKVGGADLDADLRRIDAVLEVVGSGDNLAVDANGRFDLPAASAFTKAIEPLKLHWFEEPGDPLDFALNSALTEAYETPIATGENLFSAQDAKNLALYGGMRPERDWVQLDPALAYGLTEYLKMLDMLEPLGWSRRRHVPHGGHLLGLHMAAGLQLGGTESYPLVFQPFGGFTDDAVIEDGFTAPPEAPGLGVERKSELFRVLSPLGEA
ncbi:MAG: mandelate racemase [Alphaproteobacteria bacterium]|nr:mandelate racemase [Alphaproteobacteria bacterium]